MRRLQRNSLAIKDDSLPLEIHDVTAGARKVDTQCYKWVFRSHIGGECMLNFFAA